MTALLLALTLPFAARAEEPTPRPKVDERLPFRTDFANEHLPWYRFKPGEFPPDDSEHRVGGELVEVDFIHRAGVFRMENTGEPVSFTMPPFGTVRYLNAEADLRDLPLATHLLFSLYQDETGEFTKVVSVRDDYSSLASQGLTYRLEARPDRGKILATKHRSTTNRPNLGREELRADDRTRVWKGDKQARLGDLAVGDELLVNFTHTDRQRPWLCTDVWVGVETHKRVTERQRRSHVAFLKERGLPAWIDRVDGKKLTVTLFSLDRDSLQALFKDEGIDPERWARERRPISVVVANEHLRTYWPPVTRQAATVREFQGVPTGCHGCGGVCWVIEPNLMLEGFRKGHIVRLFAHPSWPINDMPFGEGLHEGGHKDEEPADAKELEPADFPYRTDFGNAHLPWYQLQPGKFPPEHSEHRVGGELVKLDVKHRSGQFRTDRTGELVDFTLLPFGSVMLLNAEAELGDLPLGMRCLFFLFQDEKGAFTRAGVIMDEFSDLASNTLTYRLESSKLEAGRLFVARHAAPVKVDYVLEPRIPPDFGRIELEVDDQTRVWKGDQPVTLSDIAIGDELVVNRTASTRTSRGRCTDVWIGAETHRVVTERRRKKHADFLKEHGAPAWIDRVDGKDLTITFFSGSRKDFHALLGADPWGKSVHVTLADEELQAGGADLDRMGFKGRLPEGDTAGTYGCSGIRWVIAPEKRSEGYSPGRIVRVFNSGWPIKALQTNEKPHQ